MPEGNKGIVKRFYEEINKGNLDIVDELISDEFIDHEEVSGIEPNKDGVKKLFTMMHLAFQEFRIEVADMIEDGDIVVARATMKGRHKGDFFGIAPTGKEISVPFADFVRVAGGQCAEHWGVTDTGIMMQQLGQAGV